MEYDQKNFKCNLHNESYIFYCNQCKENICILCEKDHYNHNLTSLGKMIPDKDELEENKNDLKIIINKCIKDIEEIIDKLNNVIYNIEAYYQIYNDIIENYEIQNRNYQILQNINYMSKYNDGLINELDIIIDDDNIYSKFEKIINIYNQIYLNKNEPPPSNEEKIKLKYEDIIKNITNEFNLLKTKYEKVNNNGQIFKIKKYDNGDIYEGEFKNGKQDGKGIYYYFYGDRYDGEWKNDKREGKAIYYYYDGNRYDGGWKNDKFEVKGIYYFKSGSRYEGDFHNDKFEGKGIYYFNNGNRYEGEWKKDKKEGKGIFYYNDGDREMGDYLNDKKIGKHIILTVNGEIKTNIYN